MSDTSYNLSTYDALIEESRKRWKLLQAHYNPVTGEGLEELTGQKRVTLRIKDFKGLEVQNVPEEMMADPLVFAIAKAGSIQTFIDSYEWTSDVPSVIDIEHRLRSIRHKYDFAFWAFFCIKIRYKRKIKGKGKGPFILNYAQFQVLKICEEMRKAGVPINIVICKARQWGGSTFCIFYQFWLMAKWDEFHSFSVAAHVNDASRRILSMLRSALKEYPAWDLGLPDDAKLRLAPYEGSAHDFVIKDDNDSQVLQGIICVGSAEKPDSLRSADLAGAHYSEVGVWPNTPEKRPEDLIADISGGISDQEPLSMQVYESTAKTPDDFFHEVCMQAVNRESNFRCIFIPFFFIIFDTLPVQNPLEFAKWLYDHRNDEFCSGGWKSPGKYYWWLWEQGASFESINWYRYKEKTFTKRSQMVNEAPASLDEAFMSAGNLVFDFFDVQRFTNKCRPPVWEGELISDAHDGPDVIKNIRFIEQMGGKVKVWEMPDDSPISNRYAVAVDIGGPNPTSDYSSIRVIDRLMMMPDFGLNGRPNIVAEIHYHADHDKVAYDALRLAAWYNNALLIIESNTLETRDKERDTGGDGFEYIMDIVADIYDKGRLYARRKKEENIDEGTERKWGFHTNVSTKPKIIDNMRACLRDDLWDEPSKTCCQEMAIYIDDHGKFTAPPKKHDDVLMATAILLWVSYKEMDAPKWIVKKAPPKLADDIKGKNSTIVKM